MAENIDGSQWRPLATLNDVPSGEMSSHDVGDIHIALYNIDGTIFATECPLHGGQFDVCTGKAVCSPAEADLRTYPVRVVEGQIEVLLPNAES
jgi:nitrite reductase/ring-hydroxylating ferredoxin subunit